MLLEIFGAFDLFDPDGVVFSFKIFCYNISTPFGVYK